MTIDAQHANNIALAVVQQRFGQRFRVSAFDGTPSPIYTHEKIEPHQWFFFCASDPDARYVGGSQCLAIHREAGRVVLLGIVGE